MNTHQDKNWKEQLLFLDNAFSQEQCVIIDGSFEKGFPRYLSWSREFSTNNPFEKYPKLEFLLDVYFDDSLLPTVKNLKNYDNIVSLQVSGQYEFRKRDCFDEWMGYIAQIPNVRYCEIIFQSYPPPVQIPVGFPYLELLIIEASLHELPLEIERCEKLLYCNLRFVDFSQLWSDGFDRLKPCRQLRYLDLQYAKLQVFPEALTQMPALEELNLVANEIEVLPVSIGNMPVLKDLNLSGNGLATIPQEFGEIHSLEILNLSHNDLSELPKSMMKLQQLQLFDIGYNQLSQLPEWICKLSHLKVLSLHHNQIADIPWDMSKLKQLTHLKRLDLANNPLSEDCKRRLREVFPLDGPVRVTLDETDYAYYRNKA